MHFSSLISAMCPAYLAGEVERNCHFTVPGWNCMTHCQALQDFPGTSQVSLYVTIKSAYKNNSSSCRSRRVTLAFCFISECAVLHLNILIVL
jgi:hypothetical protein